MACSSKMCIRDRGLAGKFHQWGIPITEILIVSPALDVYKRQAMDVGDPSNFARIYDLYKGDHDAIAAYIGGATYKDEQIAETDVYKRQGQRSSAPRCLCCRQEYWLR